ncbi:MAG TPA: 3,4-dihydroxy-2-butanone-4-phosphate synthase [Candidatus Nanopelagicaceae bacterium]|nr:3,4-dihydroxy-2-butanone-4-phosphate synthase [Candidatus Nanopelagicaceae bacterium]
MAISSVDKAIQALQSGQLIIVTDDVDRENEGDLFVAAEFATPANIGFMIRHTSGVICVALPEARCDELRLPPMSKRNEDHKRTAFTVSVDAKEGTTTGISASERAHTIKLLGDPASSAGDFSRPGHIFPLRANANGTSSRRGHTEAAIDLMRLAGLTQSCALSELVNDDGSIMRGPVLDAFASSHGLVKVTMDQIVEARGALLREPRPVEAVATARLPRLGHEWQIFAFIGVEGDEHLLLTLGNLQDSARPLIRIHSECVTGDVFGSRRCDCGAQLNAALALIEGEGVGAILYLTGHEGRGIGLANKISAYNLQDLGADTVDANALLDLPVDARSWRDAVDILAAAGFKQCRLLTNNPAKAEALRSSGIDVEMVRLPAFSHAQNLTYLRTKQERMGHDLGLAEASKFKKDVRDVSDGSLKK